jgi:hypothetical protein
MRCVACGMRIKGKLIYEEVNGERQWLCCSGCLEYNICSCGKSLKGLTNKLELKKEMVKNQVEIRSYSFECQYCKKILNGKTEIVDKYGKTFCTQEHAIKWNNMIIEKIYR